MIDTALKLSDLIAAGALLLSLLALWLNWQTRRDTVRAKRPLVTLGPVAAQRYDWPDGWTYMQMSLRSRDNQGYLCEAISIRSPRGGLLAPLPLVDKHNVGRLEVDPEATLQGTRQLRVRVRVREEGAKPPNAAFFPLGGTDKNHYEFLVWLPPSRSIFRRRSSSSSRRCRIVFSIEAESDSRAFAVTKRLTIEPKKTTSAP